MPDPQVPAKPTQTINLINAQTNQREAVPFDQANSLILAGSHGFAPDQQVALVGSDGKNYNTTGNYAQYALKQGYGLETPFKAAINEFVESENAKGWTTSAKVALQQFGDEALGGIPEMIYEHTGDPLEVAKHEALKKEHWIANALGGIGGFAASTVIGAPLLKGAAAAGKVAEGAVLGADAIEAARAAGKVAEAAKAAQTVALTERLTAAGVADAAKVGPSLARTIAAKAAGMGVEGAVIAAPQAITEASLGDPAQAGEALLAGFGIGAAFGGIGAVGKAANLGEHLAGLLPSSEERLMKAAGVNKSIAKKLGADNLEDDARLLLNSKLENGEAVIHKPMGFEELANRIGTANEESGKRIGSTIKNMDAVLAANPGFKSEAPAASGILDRLKELQKHLDEPVFVAEQKELDRLVATIQKRGVEPTMTFQEAHDLKQVFGKIAKFELTATTTSNQVRKDAYRAVRDELDSSVERLAERSKQPAVLADYLSAKRTYEATKNFGQMIENKQNMIAGNRMFGLTDNIAASHGVSGALMGILSGHPLAGVVAGAAHVAGKKLLESTYGLTAQSLLLRKLEGLGGKGLAAGIDNIPFNPSTGDSGVTTALGDALSQSSAPNVKGILIGEQALKSVAEKVDSLPKILQRMTSGLKATTVGVSAAVRLDQWRQSQEHLATMVANQDQMNSNIDTMAATIGNTGAPNIAKAYADKNKAAIEYLYSQLPKETDPQSPFVKTKWTPSAAAIASYQRKEEIAKDPFAIFKHVEDGTLSKDHVDALKAVYPGLYASIANKIASYSYSGEAKALPYNARTVLNTLTGVPYDRSHNPTWNSQYQDLYGGAGTAVKQKRVAASKLNDLPSLQETLFDKGSHTGVGRRK